MLIRSFRRSFLPARLFFFLLFPTAVAARQSSLPSFEHQYVLHYDNENGLPSNDITGFFEDQDGYFWFTTQFGLVRFDGRDFRHYATRNIPTLGADRLFSLNSDTSHRVFFADESTAVHEIDSTGRIQVVPGAKVRYNFLMSQHGYLLDLRPYLQHTADSLRIMQEVRAPKHYQIMHEFYPDAAGHTWFLSGEDISYFKKGYFTPVGYYNPEEWSHFFIRNTLFVVDPLGSIMAYEEGRKTGFRWSLPQILQSDGKLPDLRQLSFCSNRMGTFLQYKDQLWALDFDGRSLRTIPLLKQLNLPLAKHIFYSKRYDLYILLTSTSGFYLVRRQPFSVHSFNERKGMENSFTATAEIRPMQVLTTNGTIIESNGARRVFAPGSLVPNTILKDRDQRIWMVSRDTLVCFDTGLRPLRRWAVKDAHLQSLLQDKDGTIWYCANTSLAKLENGRLEFLYLDENKLDRSQCMFFLNDSCIWIGTTRGLFAFDKKSRRITPVEGMGKAYVRHIYRARDGSIWLGTYGQGFFTYRNGSFIAMPKDRSQHLATAHCFMEDDNGFFWIPTNKGLFQVSKASLEAWITDNKQQVYFYYYDKNDGFGDNEFNGGSSPVGIRLQDGSFSLPSMMGLVWFHPQQVKPVLPLQAIRIDEVKADTQEIVLADQLDFRPGSRKISFLISSPFMGNRENFFPEYRIAGVDDLWTPVPVNNTIVINYLRPGNYTLEIRLRRGFGAGEYTVKRQPFYILPSFQETVLFKVLSLIVLAVLAAIGIKFYLVRSARRTREREVELEEQVQQRTQQLGNTVQQLKQTVAALKVSEESLHESTLMKDRLTSVIFHDIRSPLRFMSLLSNQLHQSLETDKNGKLTVLTTELKKSTHQMDAFMKEFLVWLNTQQAGFRIRNEHVYLKELFREMESFFKTILGWNNNVLEVEIGENISLWTDKQLMKIIMHNLIDNANKHTESGMIRLSADLLREDRLVIKIADSGKGMGYSELKELQNRLEEEKNIYVTESPGHLGYRIVRDFVDKLRGRITVESVINKGTIVTIVFPI